MAVQISMGDSYCSMAEGILWKRNPLKTKSAPPQLITAVFSVDWLNVKWMAAANFLFTLLPSHLRGISSFFIRTKHSTSTSGGFCSPALIFDFK